MVDGQSANLGKKMPYFLLRDILSTHDEYAPQNAS